MATGATDFGEYSVGSLPGDFTLEELDGGGNGDVTIEELSGSVSGKALKITHTGSAYRGLVSYDPASTFADGEIVMLLRVQDWQFTQAPYVGPAARFAAGSATNVVGGIISARLDFARAKYGNSVGATGPLPNALGSSSALGSSPGERWFVRYNFNGEDYKVKAWKCGTAEPSSWQVEESSATPTTSSGSIGVAFNALAAADDTWIEGIGWSDDPAVTAPSPLVTYHDNTTDFEGLSGGNWNHTQATLQNGLAVLRVINLSTQSDFFPTYDGQAMTYADITGGGVPGRVPSNDVGIWYLPLGANASSTTAAINIQGPGGANVAVKATISTYEDCDQDDPLIDTGWVSGSPPNDLPDTDNFGVVLNMDDKGYLVVDVLHSGGEADPSNPQCGKIIRADDSDFTADGQEYVFGDRTSDGPAGYMYYSDFQVTVTAFLGAASFRKALPTFSPTFGIPSEHLLKISAQLGIPSEHLREIIEEVLNRKRLWVDLGADVRTIKVEI